MPIDRRTPLPRVGTGLDVHRLVEGRPLWVAGLEWPGEPRGLDGHSDADVVCHAICDALLAAADLGDLGTVVGTDDPRWSGAGGLALLAEVVGRVTAAGYAVGNVSVQLVGPVPRLGARRAEAQEGLRRTVGAPVALAATTTDGLGLTGRGEGLAAVATALVVPVPD